MAYIGVILTLIGGSVDTVVQVLEGTPQGEPMSMRTRFQTVFRVHGLCSVDMSAWERGVVSIPVFSPQKAYLRFTCKDGLGESGGRP